MSDGNTVSQNVETQTVLDNNITVQVAQDVQEQITIGVPGPRGIPGLTGPMGSGVAWRGEYDPTTAYLLYDAVAYLGSSYACLVPCTGILPTETSNWELVAAKGDTGAASTVQGPAGSQGPTGDTGVQGIQGTTGQQGVTGAKGDIGNAGAQGNAGPTGDAFVYADFTEGQLAALVGPQGDQGIQGIQGNAGAAGQNGAAGAQGDIGITGPKGDTGATGPKGDTGATGPKGDTGDTGAPGTTTWAGITDKPSTFAPAAHTHPESEVTNLVTDLAGKAPTSHAHAESDVANLTTDLAAKKTDNVSATDKLLGRVTAGAGAIEEIACTAAGRAILDDANAAAQLATLGTAAYSEGTWTPVLNGFTIVGAAPAVLGVYRRIGNLVFLLCRIDAGQGGNTSVASTNGVSTITGVPFIVAISAVGASFATQSAGLGVGSVGGMIITAPTFSAFGKYINCSATYVV